MQLQKLVGWIRSRIRRLTGFSLVGGLVLVGGVALLGLLVEVMQVNPRAAYVVVAVLSIESNFLLNRYLNWRDRIQKGMFWAQWRRFHAARVLTFLFNQTLFNLLISMGTGWLPATLAGTVITTAINFVGLELFVFGEERNISQEALEIEQLSVPDRSRLRVSVIVPAVNESATIRACLESILNQAYPPHEIIVSTNRNDPTITQIQDLVDQGLVRLVYFDRPFDWVGRDTNMRRFIGLEAATGDILVLTDAKIWTPSDWLMKISKLIAQGNDAVAGITKRMPGDERFLSKMWDDAFFRENVRWNVRLLNRDNFGKVNGLPVTANVAFTRKVFEMIKETFPVQGFSGWEDFALSSEIIKAGFAFRVTNEVVTHRMHKVSLRVAKHLITGMAARQFYLQRPENEFSRRRNRLATVITIAQLGGLVVITIIGTVFSWQDALRFFEMMVIGLIAGLGIYNVLLANYLLAFFFPPLVLYQIQLWLTGYWISTFLKGNIPRWLADLLRSLRIILITLMGGGK